MPRLTVVAVLACTLVTLMTSATASHAAATERTGTIAFIRMANDRVFGGSLFVIRPDGSGLRRVTAPSTKVYSYAWSPDGRLIAYIDRRFSLWLVHPNGTGRRLLLPTSRLSSTSLSWSPDGKQIAIASPGANAKSASCPTTLYVVPVDGGQLVSLAAKRGCDVAWSPRGDQIADDGKGIGVVRADGTGRRHFLHDGGVPEWSADGTKLAFGIAIHLKNGGTDRYHAFATVGADGRHFHVVTTHAYNEYGVAWSPQGRRILYGRADRQGIYVIDPDSRNNHRVTRDSPPEAAWGALAWSPTGRSIVYDTGNTYKNTDLYVIGVNGRDKVRLTNTPDIDIDPSWVAR
jgi:Tol biopolymer transport system component